MEGQFRQDRQRWVLHNRLWRQTEKDMQKQRREKGEKEPPIKIGNITKIDFKKKD